MYPLKSDKNHVPELHVFVDRLSPFSYSLLLLPAIKIITIIHSTEAFVVREITLSTSRNLAPDDR